MGFPDFYESQKQSVNESLEGILSRDSNSELVEVMRYSLLNGGKRLRGVLVLEAERASTGKDQPGTNGLIFASVVELIHAYSLVHDDLPAMDNDEVRRGQPATHVKYGEAEAILAGNGLLNLAFDSLADVDGSLRAVALRRISEVTGHRRLLEGQYRDLRYERDKPAPERVLDMYACKTGALIGLSLELGALSGGLPSDRRRQFRTIGLDLGVAFQLRDDLLEHEQNGDIGKSTDSDAESRKWTYPRLVGTKEAEKKAEDLIEASQEKLGAMDLETDRLIELSEFLIERSY